MNDLRFALRQLLRNPGFASVAVLSLAIGLALTASTLAVVNAYLLRSLPYPTADRVYHLRYAPVGPWEPRGMTSIDWKSLHDVVADNITSSGATFYVKDDGPVARLRGLQVSPGFLRGLGVQAKLGRAFTAEEFATGGESVAVIGHAMWRDRFGSDPQVIGRSLRVTREDEQPETLRIVGVLPAGFWFGRDSSDAVEVMTPLRTRVRSYMVRLREGVPVSYAEKRITEVAKSVGSDFRPDWTGCHLQSVHDRYVENTRPVLVGITIAVGIVLVLVCVNVAVLMLLRAMRRQKEVAVRVALGAKGQHISHNFWQRRFGADPSVVGRAVKFYDLPFTIVGVTPGFFGFQPGENPDLWWPLHMAPQIDRDPSRGRLQAGTSWLRLIGRLSSGVERGQAEAELGVIFKRYQDEFAASRAARWSDEVRKRFFAQRFELWPARAGWTNLRDQFRQPLMILMAAVALVLLVACANIASLLLARAAARQREFSVRSALGAGRFRLIRQLLTESLLLAALGAVLGLVLAQGSTRLVQTVMRLPTDSISLNLAPDIRVLMFTIAVALAASLLFGLAPALRVRRLDLVTAMKGAAGSLSGKAERQRGFQALVVAQVSLSLILLAGAGLFVRTLQNLKGVDAGFNRENLILFHLDFAETPDAARLSLFQEELRARLESLPGVQAASLLNFGFLSGNYWTDNLLADGYEAQPGEDLECSGTLVGPRFFETFGMPILSGRGFGPADEPSAGPTNEVPKAAVINQALARRYFGDANPLGRRLYFAHRPEMQFEIAGVVADARYRSLRMAAPPTIYLPFFRADAGATFALRTSMDGQVTTASLAALARELNPTVRVRDVRTMTDVVHGSIQQERFVAHLGGFFSALALALACLGLYGVLSFTVVQRTREIGVRMALGAQRHDVLSLVIGKGLKLVLVGLLAGLAGAWSLTRFVSGLLFGVTPTDPITFAGVAMLLVVVALFASWLPARHATKVDPMEALRCE
jgi:predicted permease